MTLRLHRSNGSGQDRSARTIATLCGAAIGVLAFAPVASAQDILGGSGDLTQTVNDTVGQTTAQVDQTLETVNQTTKEVTGNVNETVEQTTGTVNRRVGEVTGAVNKAVEQTPSAVKETVGEVTGAVDKTVGDVTGGVDKTVDGVTGAVSRTVDEAKGATAGAGAAADGAVGRAGQLVGGDKDSGVVPVSPPTPPQPFFTSPTTGSLSVGAQSPTDGQRTANARDAAGAAASGSGPALGGEFGPASSSPSTLRATPGALAPDRSAAPSGPSPLGSPAAQGGGGIGGAGGFGLALIAALLLAAVLRPPRSLKRLVIAPATLRPAPYVPVLDRPG